MIDPPVITTEAYRVDVETHGAFTVGRTVIDVNRRTRLEPNCRVAMGADTALFGRIVLDTLTAP